MQVIFEITSADKFNTEEMESQTTEFAQKYKAENVNYSLSMQLNYDILNLDILPYFIILYLHYNKGRVKRRKWSWTITQGRIPWSYGYCVLVT